MFSALLRGVLRLGNSSSALRRAGRLAAVALGGQLLAAGATAQDPWALLKQPGHIVLMRHANAPGFIDEDASTDLRDCARQRNLDEAGREQARRVGEAFRQHGIRVAHILSSQFCRALDTARLMGLGPVEEQPLLNFLLQNDPSYRARAIAYLRTLPPRGLSVLVSHAPNIEIVSDVRPGFAEMVVVRFDDAGRLAVTGRIPAP